MAMKQTKTIRHDRIVRIPGLVGGKPVIRGTRIPIDLILERLTHDLDLKSLFADYSDLTEEDIPGCIAYAKELIEDKESFPTEEAAPKQANAVKN